LEGYEITLGNGETDTGVMTMKYRNNAKRLSGVASKANPNYLRLEEI
jgi:hypothetical protein